MIKSLRISNFSVFSDAEFHFGKNINVLVGTNGTGKSHLLKLAYSLLAVCAQGMRDSREPTPSDAFLRGAIARKLLGVFCPDALGRLTRRHDGVDKSFVEFQGEDPGFGLAFGFNGMSKTEVLVTKTPDHWLDKRPVFLPPRDLLATYPGFVSLYETTAIPFEETWRDTCLLLGAPLARDQERPALRVLLDPVEQTLGGKVVLDSSERFYLSRAGSCTEMHMVAEGLRKLAMIARLIGTGSLVDKGWLFWDEPDASLNPGIIKDVAQSVVNLGRNGIQVFVATHSLFLMRELYMLEDGLDARYFGLHFSKDGGVSVREGESVDDIGPIAALDESLEQSGRYMDRERMLGDLQ